VCCSERCLQNHIKAAHPKQAAAQQAQKEVQEIERENRRRELKRAHNELDRLEKEKAEAESGLRGECPNCGAVLSIPRKFKGKKIPCPHCKVELHVPEAEVLEAPEEPGEPFWTVRRVVIGLTFWAVVLSCCCGVPGWIYHAQQPRLEANRLYDEGRKAEAVAMYQEMWEQVGAPPDMLKRIVEYHLETKNEAEATRWIEKGLDHDTIMDYDTPAANSLLEKVKARRADKPK
jgi:hypothetical protein